MALCLYGLGVLVNTSRAIASAWSS
jgi:hypothetical protein